ncbi:hypothetical protein [Virgibacillus salexigens]|uniref:Uncharacterized protein n=1 Tax=Virgibacillus massiliensis TaxID=1462526 RepID=A0A024QHD0_9BACI|nr:hypothetical protein [Virgibacillus massiliensis]CDQ41899.1 hypothetical protein BN990_04278 [Virgibacillus massiliensis]
MSRKKPKILYAFHRFMEGIFSYYLDKGMAKNNAKLRMYKETYETCLDFAKKEKDIPDHALIATMQHASRHLNQRGISLSETLKKDPSNSNKEEIRIALHSIKKVKDAADEFITTYRGES